MSHVSAAIKSRIHRPSLYSKVVPCASSLVHHFKHGDAIGWSGFTVRSTFLSLLDLSSDWLDRLRCRCVMSGNQLPRWSYPPPHPPFYAAPNLTLVNPPTGEVRPYNVIHSLMPLLILSHSHLLLLRFSNLTGCRIPQDASYCSRTL